MNFSHLSEASECPPAPTVSFSGVASTSSPSRKFWLIHMAMRAGRSLICRWTELLGTTNSPSAGRGSGEGALLASVLDGDTGTPFPSTRQYIEKRGSWRVSSKTW